MFKVLYDFFILVIELGSFFSSILLVYHAYCMYKEGMLENLESKKEHKEDKKKHKNDDDYIDSDFTPTYISKIPTFDGISVEKVECKLTIILYSTYFNLSEYESLYNYYLQRSESNEDDTFEIIIITLYANSNTVRKFEVFASSKPEVTVYNILDVSNFEMIILGLVNASGKYILVYSFLHFQNYDDFTYILDQNRSDTFLAVGVCDNSETDQAMLNTNVGILLQKFINYMTSINGCPVIGFNSTRSYLFSRKAANLIFKHCHPASHDFDVEIIVFSSRIGIEIEYVRSTTISRPRNLSVEVIVTLIVWAIVTLRHKHRTKIDRRVY